MGGGDTDKEVKPAPPPLITSMPLMPAVDQTPLMQSHPGGSSLASFGARPMPASMLMTPTSWSSLLDPNALQMSVMRPPNIGSFVLDPALDLPIPEGLDVHVRVDSALPGDAPYYVVLERPVRAAARLAVYAVRIENVYETSMEAFAARPMFSALRTLPVITRGATYWTSAGPIVALGCSDSAVFTATPNLDTGAAGAVVLLQTDGGVVMIDAGMQAPDPGLSATVGDELGREVAAYLAGSDLGEAILSRKAPAGHVTPYVGKLVRIRTLRGTLEQYQDGSIGEVLAVQREYRAWYLESLRQKLVAERASWESSQPIAPNNGVREQRWQQHLESAIAAAVREATPPALAVATNNGAFTDVSAPPAPVEQELKRDAAGAVDLTEMDWEPADDEQYVALAGPKVGVFPAKGVLYRPAAVPTAPEPPKSRSVPELKAAGEHGPSLPAPRAVTPWAVMGALGKEGAMLVRIKSGYAVLVDAGGVPRAMTLDGIAAAQVEMSARIDKILVTHPHGDHVRNIIDLIKGDAVRGLAPIRAENLVVSRAWKDVGLIKALRANDAALIALGFGPRWEPSHVAQGTGTIHLPITVDGTQIDVYTRPDAHRDLEVSLQRSRDAKAAGRRKTDTIDSKKFDSASFLYVIGNESSPNRMAIIGDLRGADILKMRTDLTAGGADGFRAAFKNVRVVQGLGHHLSLTAGTTAEDVAGMDALLEATLHQNGELTIMVQSRESFAFDGAPTRMGVEGALVHYLERQGVRVVFAGAADATTPSAARLDSSARVTTSGPSIRVFDAADPRIREMWDRINLLREAKKTAAKEHGAEALGMKDEVLLESAIDRELNALLDVAADLRDLAGRELLQARGDAVELAKRPVPKRTEAQLFAALVQKGPIETGLSPEVAARLRAAIASGRPMAMYVQFGAVPRELLDALEKVDPKILTPEQREALADKYTELAELTSKLDGVEVPDKDRLDILARAKQLRGELELALKAVPEHEQLKAELARMDAAIKKLEAETLVVGENVGRDARGKLTRTKYVKLREGVQKGAELLGKGMGALMVIHSVEELGGALTASDASAPQRALELTHSVYGIDMGIRMMRGVHVGGGEFAVMSVIEVGIAATGTYETTRERDLAIHQAELSAAANLGCMALGEGVMYASAFLPPPFDIVGFGLGLAITFAGDRVLELLGLKHHDYIAELAGDIEPALDEYKAIIGTKQLADRSDEELAALGVKDPETFKVRAIESTRDHLEEARTKERDITKLFEKAYGDARKSAKQLEYLDAKAAEFLRLRGQAMQGLPDPQRAGLDARWRAMDTHVALDASRGDDPYDMDQWGDIDDKLENIGNLIHPFDEADRAKILHEMTEVDEMLENARYRVESASRGGMRPDPILEKGSAARTHYLDVLSAFERRLASYQQDLVHLSAHTDEPVLGWDNYGVEPSQAYARLKVIRADYEKSVQHATDQMPQLKSSEIWASLTDLSANVLAYNNGFPETFRDLHVLEMSLQIAIHQASSSLVIADLAADDPLRAVIEAEVAAAKTAIDARQYTYGLIFKEELPTLVTSRSEDTDKEIAAKLDLAYSKRIKVPASGIPLRAFSEPELKAAHTGVFDQDTTNLTSTSAQLKIVRELVTKRVGDEDINARNVKDLVGRTYFTLANPFHRVDPDQYLHGHSYAQGMTPIVMQPGDATAESIISGDLLTLVLPVNQDAVTILGSGFVAIMPNDLIRVQEDAILDAKQDKKQP